MARERKQNWLRTVKQYLGEHYKILLATILSITGISLLSMISGFWQNTMLPFLTYKISVSAQVWLALVLLSIIAVTTRLCFRLYTKVKLTNIPAVSVTRRPTFVKEQYQERLLGLVWRAYIGDDIFDRYIHLEGPFCPICDYELDAQKPGTWYCIRCNKKYKVEKLYARDTINKVKKIVESNHRKKGGR